MKKIFLTILGIGVLGYLLFYFYPATVFKPYFFIKYPESKYALVYVSPSDRSIPNDIKADGKTYKIGNLQFQTSFGEPATNKVGAGGDIVNLTFSDNKRVIVGKSNNELRKFDYYNEVANITPSQLSLFDDKSTFVSKFKYLILKMVVMLNTNSNQFYKFDTSTVRGFQMGTPGQDNVSLQIFDQNDAYSFNFNKDVSQEEIDAIVLSMQ